MKSKSLEIQIRRHLLSVAFEEEKVMNCPVALAPPGKTVRAGWPPSQAPEAKREALLLISNDSRLTERLGSAADLAGLDFRQTNNPPDALRWIAEYRPAVVCLDLDLPESAAWEAAEKLLQDKACQTLILFSSRTDRFDLGAAIRAGAVVDKAANPAQLLERVDGILSEAEIERADRRARQRMLVRWLRPYQWSGASETTFRDWGINE